MTSYLVTGSSRGIGLEIVTYLLSRPPTETKIVFATARDSKNCASLVSLANSPEGLGRIILVNLDVCDKASVDLAASVVQRSLGSKGGLDVLINSAGVLTGKHSIGDMTDEELQQMLQTNAFGVHRVTRAFLPLLRKGTQKKMVNISVTLGSMAGTARDATRGPLFPASGYAISKTAMNMINTQWAIALKGEGFIVAVICPAREASDMGAIQAHLRGDVGAKAVVERVDQLDKSDNGKFMKAQVPDARTPSTVQYDRSEIPWWSSNDL